jgi:hypothetical protein
MDLKRFNKNYGRQTLVFISLLTWAYIIWSFFTNGYINTWYKWHIPAKEPAFIDFRVIPSGAETFRSGMDPSVSNPNDPKNHIFNYPKIWYIFFYTGITQDDTVWLSILLIVLFFLTVFVFSERLSVIDSLLTLLVVFSPAAMLLYERGNVDLVFFSLCGLAILLLEQKPGWTVTVLLISAIFKLFPFFGVGIFLRYNKGKFYRYFLISLILFLSYMAVSFDSFTAAWKLTLRGTMISYGAQVVFDLLHAYFRYYLLQVIPSEDYVLSVLKWLPYIVAGLFLAIIFFLGTGSKEPYRTDSEGDLTAFRMGALIYVGTFLLGNNWDYRLAFLIFTVPQLSRWLFLVGNKQRWIVVVVFLSLLFSCWNIYINQSVMMATDFLYKLPMNILDELINWILFGGLAYLFFISAPEWFRSFNWFPSHKEVD